MIRDEIIRLSGSGKRVVSTRKHGLYSSFTLPGLDDMEAVRDTAQRFDDFGVPARLDRKFVLDIGCNVGAVSFEATRRGASVLGLEYRQDRVDLCRRIAGEYDQDAMFKQVDLRETQPDVRADIVFCCSVTEYVEDSFYDWLRGTVKGVLYLECNRQSDWEEWDTERMFSGFRVLYLGNGDSGGISRKRKLYDIRPA